jgi:hypothetical protein
VTRTDLWRTMVGDILTCIHWGQDEVWVLGGAKGFARGLTRGQRQRWSQTERNTQARGPQQPLGGCWYGVVGS